MSAGHPVSSVGETFRSGLGPLASLRRGVQVRPVRRHGRGFTLVEVLVALGIAAISLTAALRATGSMVVSNEQMRSRLLATWAAENQMALIRLEQRWPDVGLTRLDCSQGALKLTCSQRVTQMPYREIRGVELEVFDAQGHRLARLVGFAKSN